MIQNLALLLVVFRVTERESTVVKGLKCSQSVSWCITPSQPVRLYQGERKMQLSKIKTHKMLKTTFV